MESDENKMLKAAQLMVANLAGSLALVTCHEPLRGSMSTHLRQLLTSNVGNGDGRTSSTPQLSEEEHNTIDECVSICASDNLEFGCMLIEKAATEKDVRDMSETLDPQLSAKRKHCEQTGQPLVDMSIFGSENESSYRLLVVSLVVQFALKVFRQYFQTFPQELKVSQRSRSFFFARLMDALFVRMPFHGLLFVPFFYFESRGHS